MSDGSSPLRFTVNMRITILTASPLFSHISEPVAALVHIIDESKAFLADFRHRALRHHAESIFLAEKLFGVAIVNSEGKQVPVRYVGEQHVKEDLGRIPTAQDWLVQIKAQRWMYGQRLDEETPTSKEALL